MSKNRHNNFTKKLITSLLLTNCLWAGSDPFTDENENLIEQAEGAAIASRPNPVGFYDSVILEYTSDRVIHLSSDVSMGQGFNTMWEEVTFKGKNGYTHLDIRPLSSSTYQEDGSLKKISLRVLNLEDINIDSKIRFDFLQGDNIINFDNARIHFDTHEPTFISTGTLTINSLTATENILYALSGDYLPASTEINVENGSKFTIQNSGTGRSASSKLHFLSDFTANVDASELVLDYSYVEANKGTINLINGSTLTLTGSDTGFSVKDLYVENSTIDNPANGIKTINIANDFTLIDSTLNLGQAELEVTKFLVKGSNHISANDQFESFRMEVLQTLDNSATDLTIQNYNFFRVETALLSNNLTINVDNAHFTLPEGSDLVASGGSINLANRTFLNIYGTIKGSGGTINATDSKIGFYKGSTGFELGGPVDVNLTDSILEVYTNFTGTGTIGDANSSIFIRPDGRGTTAATMSLGNASNPIGTLSTDAFVQFYGGILTTNQVLIDSNLFDGGTLEVDVQYATNNTAENDQIQFGANDVNITLLKEIVVKVPDNSTASQLDKQEFTIISAQPAAAGEIVFNKTSKTVEDLIIEDSSVPVLIDFRVVDNNTNGKEDITLLAEENLPVNLQKHQNLNSRNHKGAATLVGNAAGSNSAINNSLNSLTNGQLASHLDTIHPEGYSSYMTVGMEASLLALETVSSNTRGNTFRAPLAMVANDEQAPMKGEYQREFWADLGYVNGSIDEDGELGSIDYSITSFLFGQDLVVDHNSRLGLFSGYSYYKMDEHGISDVNLDTDALYFGAYGQFMKDDLIINASMGYAYGMNESERDSTLGAISGTSEADYDSHSFFIGSNVQKAIYSNQTLTLYPELGMYYVYYYQESFDESGNSALDLSIDSADAHSLVNSIGLNIQFADFGEGYTMSPSLFIRYEHDWVADDDSEHDIQASLKNSKSGKHSFAGQNRGANHLATGFDFAAKMSENIDINLGSTYTYSDDGDEYGLNARFIYSF